MGGLFCFYLQVLISQSKLAAIVTTLRAVLGVLSHPPESSEHAVRFLHALEMTVTSY